MQTTTKRKQTTMIHIQTKTKTNDPFSRKSDFVQAQNMLVLE